MSAIPLHFPEAIDSTMLSAFDACPQKWLIEFVLRRMPVGRSIHLHAGGCVASAFEEVRVHIFLHDLPLDIALRKAFVNYCKNWGDFVMPEDSYKDFTNCWCAIEAYFKEYPPHTDYFQPYIKRDGEPAVEFHFSIPMKLKHPETGNPILFSGRGDMLAQPKGTDTIYVVDEKTTKNLGASWQYQWGMRGQFYGYTHAARQMGFNAVGALVRGIGIQQTQYQFQEKPILLTKEQTDTWWREAHKKVKRMLEMYDMAGTLYPPPPEASEKQQLYARHWLHDTFDKSFGEACTSYTRCVFTDLCTHPEPWRLYEDYEERIWDPSAKDPSSKSENRQQQLGEVSWQEFMGEE